MYIYIYIYIHREIERGPWRRRRWWWTRACSGGASAPFDELPEHPNTLTQRSSATVYVVMRMCYVFLLIVYLPPREVLRLLLRNAVVRDGCLTIVSEVPVLAVSPSFKLLRRGHDEGQRREGSCKLPSASVWRGACTMCFQWIKLSGI